MPKSPKTVDASQTFYVDILARSLLRIGIPKYQAYEISHQISDQLSHQAKDPKEVARLVEVILKAKYPKLLGRYHDWRKIMNSEKPLIILIDGGTGIGTSTLAMRVGWLLEIIRIVSTDSVREVIRQFLREDVLPILHASSYQVGELVKEVKSEHDRLIFGFLTQSKEVLHGVEAVVRRAIKEKVNAIIEGVHLVPGEMGFLKKYQKEATIVEVMLDVKLKSKHQQHFQSRHLQNANRKKQRYMRYFKEIRLVRDFLVCQAEKNDVPVVENYDLRKAEQQILEIVYSHYFHP